MRTSNAIPQGTQLAKYWTEGFRLRPRKKKFVKGNIEPRLGYAYWIYSEYRRCWYFRKITKDSDFWALITNINKGIVYFSFSQENLEEIDKEKESYGLSYDDMNKLRMYQFSLDRHLNTANKEYGFLSKKKHLEEKIWEIENNKK